MLSNEIINNIFGIKEAYELPSKLLSILLDEEKKNDIFNKFLEYEKDRSFDWFTNYFQNEQGDRKKLKQDYTPNCICRILEGLNTNAKEYIGDICAGSGGLTISQWNNNKEALFYLEEISTRVLPILLFNLAIRGINAIVKEGDTLHNNFSKIYKLERENNGFSSIQEIKDTENFKLDYIISNPPYSLNWNNKEYAKDERFKEYAVPPSSKADYGFVLHALSKLNENGEMLFILPHGILFRGGKEKDIRQKLIDNNLIDCVIGLPNKLFLNTDITICLFIIKKNRATEDILFIDASREYKKGTKQNDLEQEHIQKILQTYHKREVVDKYSSLVLKWEIIKNEYNLNIPRYVDTFEKEEVPNIVDTMKELVKTEKEIDEANARLLKMMKKLQGSTIEGDKEIKEAIRLFENVILKNYKIEKQIELEI